MHPLYGYLSTSEQNPKINDPFARPDQIIFDFLPNEKASGPSTSNQFSSPMLNSLFQGIDNREVCGDHKDNNKNGLVDENCSSLPSDQLNIVNHDSLVQPPLNLPTNDNDASNPETEICGDGQDNDGNGIIDENCDDQQQPPDSPSDDNPEPEICGDGQDNDGNGVIDDNCNNQPDQPPASDDNPEAEICGDGQDNDGNGMVDEYCETD